MAKTFVFLLIITKDAKERSLLQEIQQKEWHTQQMEENALKRRMAEASDKYSYIVTLGDLRSRREHLQR